VSGTGKSFAGRLLQCAREIVKPTLRIIRFLLLIMLPVSFVMLILETSGIMLIISRFMDPLMQFLGLPGEASLAFLSSVFINVYSAIAVMETLALSGKQLIILATMCLIAHNFFVECVVMKKTGSRLYRMVLLRIINAFFAAWIMNMIVPKDAGRVVVGSIAEGTAAGFGMAAFLVRILPWLQHSLFLVLQIFLIVFAVMFVQRILREFGLMEKLARITEPLLRFLGLPANTGYVWIIAETVGVAYGAGILIEEVKSGKISRPDADLVNHYAAISHSQIEDTLLFVSLGVPYVWAALPRFLLAAVVVWVERARRAIFRSSFHVRVEGNR
jgi:spore maturation protein SpmB